MARYTIFGAGPSGLYTAWRLITSGKIKQDDTLELFEWGNYAFDGPGSGTRRPAGRICSYSYQNDDDNSYIELGGMRYLEWKPETAEGHQLVTKTITSLGLDSLVIDFNTTTDPLFFLRGEHFYQNEIKDGSITAPYNTLYRGDTATVLFGDVSGFMTKGSKIKTRAEQCEFYSSGTLPADYGASLPEGSSVYKGGEIVSNLGYWNVFYDAVGNEAYQYAADAGGYASNTINWNAANAAVYNGEFAPGGTFKTLSSGYSHLFYELYQQTKQAAERMGVSFTLTQEKRLLSIWVEGPSTFFQTASASTPNKSDGFPSQTDFAFLAMPPESVKLVAEATQYRELSPNAVDILNNPDVQNYLGAVLAQPSFKVAMFFDRPWWKEAEFAPKLTNEAGDKNIFGPTITDIPLRQVYYFGDNAEVASKPVYGLLASYDDMRFTRFWEEMQLSVDTRQTIAWKDNIQPLKGPQKAPESMVNMLRAELTKVHCGVGIQQAEIPEPLETVFMDWGLKPFYAGYHAWAAHYDICDVMQTIRAPAKLAGTGAQVFLLGSAFSNDQAWVEGAFCTAESVLNDFLGVPTVADTTNYPLICPCSSK